jgi:hypothetical protein
LGQTKSRDGSKKLGGEELVIERDFKSITQENKGADRSFCGTGQVICEPLEEDSDL